MIIKLIRFFIVLLLAALAVNSTIAINPTPQQIQMFMSLPRAQQEALAAQYGIDLSQLQNLQGNQATQQPQVQIPIEAQSTQEMMKEDEEELEVTGAEIDEIVKRCYDRFEDEIIAEQIKDKEEQENKSFEIALDNISGNAVSSVSEQLAQEERLKYINIESILENRLLAKDEEDDPVEVCIKRYLGYKWTVKNELESIEAEIEEVNQLVKEVKPFGYELFKEKDRFVADTANVPVPLSYVMGPGDMVLVQLFGKENANYELTVDRDGRVQFPDLGPINIAGLEFKAARELLLSAVSNQMIGVKANITLGELRSISVFVMGEVENPGAYTINAMSTITQAIYKAGGITEIGSLRSIQLKRKSKTVTQLDLYKLLLHGEIDTNTRLLPGDVVFVPTIGKTVGVSGDVRRPAVYELKHETKISQVLALAGGVTPEAYPKAAKIKRIDKNGDRTLIDVNLKSKTALSKKVMDGDVIDVPSVLDKIEATVMLTGHVHRPGGFAWFDGMRVRDVVRSIKNLKPNPDLKYALIKREIQPTREIRVIRINLRNALSTPQSRDNLALQPRDELIIFGLAEPRTEYLQDLIEGLVGQASYNEYPKIATIIGNVRFPDTFPLYEGMTVQGLIESAFDLRPDTDMDYVIIKRRKQNIGKIDIINISLRSEELENFFIKPLDEVYVLNLNEDRSKVMQPIVEALKAQARKGEEEQLVEIRGDVRFPGEYPLLPGVRIKEIIAAAGGLNESAYVLEAEVTRTDFTDPRKITVSHRSIDLNAAMSDDDENNVVLFPKDRVSIRKIPNWQEELSINVLGEVRFPGTFTFRRGETLSNILQRAGGLTNFAHPKAAIFTRDELKKQEAEQIRLLQKRLQADIAASSLEEGSTISSAILKDADALLSKLNNAEPVGRLVIDLPAILDDPRLNDIVLKPGDNLYIPASKQSVSVIGEVQFTSSHLYQSSLSLEDYLDRAGGMTQKADDGRVYIVKANGSVLIPNSGSSWFAHSRAKLEPGDTIVVPIDSDRVKPLTAWTKVTQIIYQVGLAAAAIASL